MAAPHREQHDGYLENYQRTGHAKIIGIGRETFARKKDGTLFPIDLSVSEVKLSDRRIFTGFVRDITERKRLEKEISKSASASSGASARICTTGCASISPALRC